MLPSTFVGIGALIILLTACWAIIAFVTRFGDDPLITILGVVLGAFFVLVMGSLVQNYRPPT